MRICMTCFKKFDAIGSESKCLECSEGKEIILALPSVYIDLDKQFVDKFEEFEKQDGRFGCFKYKIRLKEHDRYTFGITVYDHRDGKVSGYASFRLMRAAKKFVEVTKEYFYIVLGWPQAARSNYVLCAEIVDDSFIEDDYIWQFFGKSYDEKEIIRWRLVLKDEK